ncbi:hypothetical protein EDD15DRAFT_2200411 [Pisolithus albus]|nr:hypothetical protein EDD15DRAFT_2200411 [Pisolithus albus]
MSEYLEKALQQTTQPFLRHAYLLPVTTSTVPRDAAGMPFKMSFDSQYWVLGHNYWRNIKTHQLQYAVLLCWVVLYIGDGICMLAVGDDEHGGVLTVTGDVDALACCRRSYSTFLAEYVEESPTPNGSAVLEICVLAVGDDEHGGVLAVTSDAGTSASCARDAVIQI